MSDRGRRVSVGVVARRLGVSGQTIRNWINADLLEFFRTPTGRYMVPMSEIERLLKTKSQDRKTQQLTADEAVAS